MPLVVRGVEGRVRYYCVKSDESDKDTCFSNNHIILSYFMGIIVGG